MVKKVIDSIPEEDTDKLIKAVSKKLSKYAVDEKTAKEVQDEYGVDISESKNLGEAVENICYDPEVNKPAKDIITFILSAVLTGVGGAALVPVIVAVFKFIPNGLFAKLMVNNLWELIPLVGPFIHVGSNIFDVIKYSKKKKVKEDFDMNTTKIANFIKGSVKNLIDGSATNNRYKLDDRLAIFVGWSDGFDEDDDAIIHNEDSPSFGIVAGIKVWTSDDLWTDYDFLNYPYYEDGEVVDISSYVSPDEDYNSLAEYLISEYEGIKHLDIEEDGKIIVDLQEPDEDYNLFDESFKDAMKINWQELRKQISQRLSEMPSTEAKKIKVVFPAGKIGDGNTTKMKVYYTFPKTGKQWVDDEFEGEKGLFFETTLEYIPERDIIVIEYYGSHYKVSSVDELASWIDETI